MKKQRATTPNEYNSKRLIHGFIEGPKHGIQYDGEAVLCDGIALVNLPEYFDKLASRDTPIHIQLTNIDGWTPLVVKLQSDCKVCGNCFYVCTTDDGVKNAKFDWQVSGTRGDKFIKENTNIFALDSFGFYADKIKENVTKFDSHYQGSYKPFTKKTRFKEFDYLILQKELNEIIKKKNCDLDIIKCYFPDNIEEKHFDTIKSKSYSFVHLDFDLFTPTLDVIKFIIPRLEKNAIMLLDDYNLINQEGVKWAVGESAINLNKCIQTQSGQLIYHA